MNEIDALVLEQVVYGDAAHVAHLVMEGRSAEADAYASQPAVADRIRRWKANRA